MVRFSFQRNLLPFVFVVLLTVGDVADVVRRVTAAASDMPAQVQQQALTKLTELHDQFEKSIQILLGTDTRLIRVDTTKHTANVQIEFCPSALPIAMNAILTYANPTNLQLTDSSSNYSNKGLEIKVLSSAIEICILCITNNPTNRAIFSEGQNLEQQQGGYTIHTAVVSLLRVTELAAKAGHLIWIATYSNSKNHFHFIKSNVIHELSEVIVSVPYPIPTDATTSPLALTVMWASAALQNLAASYCDNEDGGTCGWDWMKHEPEEGNFEYSFELTEESGSLLIDATEVRQAIASNIALIARLLQWSCHGPVSGSMTIDNPFPGQNAISIPEHESSMNIVPWAALGAISNIAIDPAVKIQLLEHYGDTMPCFCFMSTSPDWLEAVKGQYVLQHVRHDKDPCWFDFHGTDSPNVDEHTLCVDRLFTDIGGSTCSDYNDPETLNEEECATPSIDNETYLANMACCLCEGGDHYPNNHPMNIHEPDEESLRQLDEHINEVGQEHEHAEEEEEGEEEHHEDEEGITTESDEEESDFEEEL